MPILEIYNDPLLEGETTRTIALASAGDSTITVESIAGFSVGDFILIGSFGEEKAEIIRVNTGTAPSGNTITLQSTLVFDHNTNTQITIIYYDQAEFSRATTVSGAKSILNTKNVQADNIITSYRDSTNTTGFGFIRFKNSVSSTYSSYSGAIPYAGIASNSVRAIKEDALRLTKEKIGELITHEFLLESANNFQREVSGFRNWNFESTTTTTQIVSGQKNYSLATLLPNLKQTHEGSGVIQVRMKNYEKMKQIDKREFDEEMTGTITTTLAASVALVDTTITLTDSSDFNSSGSIEVDGDVINYTANDTTTNILSGVTGITATHSSGATVWQTSSLGQPIYWTIYEDQLYLNPVASSTYNGFNLYIDHYKNLPTLADDMDTTEVPFYHIAKYYIAWEIELLKGDPNNKADYYRQIFENRMAGFARKNKPEVHRAFSLSRT